MFPHLHTSHLAGWGCIYKPHWESSRWGRSPAFLLLTKHWNRPDRTRLAVPTVEAANNWSDAANVRSQVRRSRTSLYSIGRCCPASGRFAASVRSLLLLPSLWSECLVSFCQHPVQRLVATVSSFLRDLACGLVPIFMLGFCLISWVFSYAPKVLLEVLIIISSCRLCPSHILHPIELQKNYLQIH